ncbi:hypothetical protein TruAng_010758 [Truncatella angustata]|nr:hypothetical protein TruAng_010758 [Truncatella angustata]
MSEAQEPRIQPLAQAQAEVQIQAKGQAQAQAQARTSSQPQPVLALPDIVNKDTSSSSHGTNLPALVSSNLPAISALDRNPSQRSQAPGESETHTQPSPATHDQARAHDTKPEEHYYQQENLRLEGVGSVTNPQKLHGVIEAVGAREAEKDVNIPAADVNKFTLKIFPSLPPISETIPTPTNHTTLLAPTVSTDPSSASSSSAPTSDPTHSNVVPAEVHGTLQTGSAPLPPNPPPAMSNPPHHPGHGRPPVGFPSPTYGSQGIYGYGSPSGATGDPYRGHPGGHQPMSLPSMRTFDPVQQQQAQQAPMAQQMMQVQASMPPYYGHAVPLAGNPYSLPPEAMGSRYALPPSDPRFLGNPRNKKVGSYSAPRYHYSGRA